MRRTQRGLTLLESAAATAVLGVALLASSGLLLEWRHVSRQLERRAAAELALAQEMDELLARGIAGLSSGPSSWRSGADETCGLPEARGQVLAVPFGDTGLRRVLVRIEWEGGAASRETLLGGRR